MDVTNAITPTQTAAVQPAAAASSANVLTSDFETFLKMLTTQAENQDPLEPLDSSDYAAQLAQFSMVEQQVSTNELIQQMLAALGTSDMAGAASWIGKEALVTGPARFQGGPITIAPNPPVAADEVNLVVHNAAGTEVQRIALPVSAEPYQWTGITDSGALMEYGEYSFAIESRADGEVLMTEQARSYSRVTEARIEDGAVLLVLDSGYMIDAGNVIGLREAPV